MLVIRDIRIEGSGHFSFKRWSLDVRVPKLMQNYLGAMRDSHGMNWLS